MEEESTTLSTEELFNSDFKPVEPTEEVTPEVVQEENEVVEESKDEIEPKPEEEGKEESAEVSPWDKDENPYFAKTSELEKEIEKQKGLLKETSNYANNKNMEALNAQNALKRIESKLDGTYDEEADTSKIDETAVAEFTAKFNASNKLAEKEFGADTLKEKLYDINSPYQRLNPNANPVIVARIQNSDTPVHEALRIVEEEEFFDKYGRDFETVKSKITEEVEPELRKQITKELHDKIKLKKKIPNSLGDVNGSEVNEDERTHTPTTKELFG